MTVFVMACITIAAFLLGFKIMGIVPTARRALDTAQYAGKVMLDADMDELTKEKAVQKSAIGLLAGCLSIAFRSLAALLIALLPLWFADAAGLVMMDDVFAYLQQWHVIVVTTAVITAGWLIAFKKRTSS